TSKSEITPSCNGRTAIMCAGVRPTISLASLPMALTALRRREERSMATIEGSLITIPRFFTCTNVLAVPRSMPMSREKRPNSQSNGLFTGYYPPLLYVLCLKVGVFAQSKPQLSKESQFIDKESPLCATFLLIMTRLGNLQNQ